MSEEVVRPQDILDDGLRKKLEDAVIDAYMAKGAQEAGHTNLKFHHKDGDDWVYEFSVTGNNPEVICDKSGHWRQSRGQVGPLNLYPDKGLSAGTDYVDVGDNAYSVTLFDAPAAWDDVRARVAQWVDPWVGGGCPSPNVYTNQINSMATIAKQLYIGDINSPSETSTADEDLRDAVKQMGISASMTSAGVVAFQETYGTDIGTTIGGQNAMALTAGLALTAEASAWSETYRSVRELLQVAANDFASLAGSHPPYGEKTKAVLDAAKTVISVLSLAGKAYPPFGTAMSVTSTGIGVFQALNPAIPGVADESLVLEGSSYEAKWTSFEAQMKKIDTNLTTAEKAIEDNCRARIADLDNHPANYSITRGGRKGQGRDEQSLANVMKQDLDLSIKNLKKIAAACELISKHQKGLASILGGADAAGNPSALVRDEWSRSSLPGLGLIGLDWNGPYDAYADLIEALIDLLIGESKTSHDVAGWVYQHAKEMDYQDTLAGLSLRDIWKEIDDRPLYRGNDPTNPDSISTSPAGT